MLSEIYNIQYHLQTLKNNINILETTCDSLIFNINTKEMEKIILLIKNKSCNKKNLFDKYIKKEIFSNILSFLSKEYVITKRSTCKNWNDILSNNFIKNSLGPFTEPFNISYLNCFNNKFENIKKINNKLCCYYYLDEYIKTLDDNGELINKYKVKKNIIIFSNTDLVWYEDYKIIIKNSNKKIIIEWSKPIYDIIVDENNIYILSGKIYKYDRKGTFIGSFNIGFHEINSKNKTIIDNKQIFHLGPRSYIYIYSNNGTFLKCINTRNKIGNFATFDIYKDKIYMINEPENIIKIYTKEGKGIYYKKHNIKKIRNLFAIDDKLYIITMDKIHIYEIKFF